MSCEPKKKLDFLWSFHFPMDFQMGSSLPFISWWIKDNTDLIVHVLFPMGSQIKQTSSSSFGLTEIAAIFFKVSSNSSSSNRCHFHPLFSSHSSSTDLSSIAGVMTLVASLLKGSLQAQEWNQNRVLLPFPTSALAPYLMSLAFSEMACHTLEASRLLEDISMSHLPLQYFARITLDHKLSFSFISR